MKGKTCGFEEIPHTADWALHVWAADFPDLLNISAQGMYALCGASWSECNLERCRIWLPVADREETLVRFLAELLYLLEIQCVGLSNFEFLPSPDGWTVLGDAGKLSELRKEIKAVTYHQLEIIETSRGLEATIVLDV